MYVALLLPSGASLGISTVITGAVYTMRLIFTTGVTVPCLRAASTHISSSLTVVLVVSIPLAFKTPHRVRNVYINYYTVV